MWFSSSFFSKDLNFSRIFYSFRIFLNKDLKKLKQLKIYSFVKFLVIKKIYKKVTRMYIYVNCYQVFIKRIKQNKIQ